MTIPTSGFRRPAPFNISDACGVSAVDVVGAFSTLGKGRISFGISSSDGNKDVLTLKPMDLLFSVFASKCLTANSDERDCLIRFSRFSYAGEHGFLPRFCRVFLLMSSFWICFDLRHMSLNACTAFPSPEIFLKHFRQTFVERIPTSSSDTSIPPIPFNFSSMFSFLAVFPNKSTLSKTFANAELQQRQFFNVVLHAFVGVSLITKAAMVLFSSSSSIPEKTSSIFFLL